MRRLFDEREKRERKTPCEWQPLASADVIDSATRRADGSRSPWARSARRQSECSSPIDSRDMWNEQSLQTAYFANTAPL